jgi:hypothetical protein
VRSDRVRRAALAPLVGLLLMGCDAPAIPSAEAGYDPAGLTGFLYHWGPGRSLAIHVDPSGAPAGVDLAEDVRAGMRAWASVVRLGEVRWHLTDRRDEADVLVRHAVTPRPVTADDCPDDAPPATAFTFFCVDDDGRAQVLAFRDGRPGRVKMDVAIDTRFIDDADTRRAIVTHELGHVLGLGAHTSDPNDVMFAFPRRSTPSDADARSLRWLFAQRADVPF